MKINVKESIKNNGTWIFEVCEKTGEIIETGYGYKSYKEAENVAWETKKQLILGRLHGGFYK